jgi:hypothetical protein
MFVFLCGHNILYINTTLKFNFSSFVCLLLLQRLCKCILDILNNFQSIFTKTRPTHNSIFRLWASPKIMRISQRNNITGKYSCENGVQFSDQFVQQKYSNQICHMTHFPPITTCKLWLYHLVGVHICVILFFPFSWCPSPYQAGILRLQMY